MARWDVDAVQNSLRFEAIALNEIGFRAPMFFLDGAAGLRAICIFSCPSLITGFSSGTARICIAGFLFP